MSKESSAMSKRTRQCQYVFCALSFALTLFGRIPDCQAQKIRKDKPGVYITFKEFVGKVAARSNTSEGARFVLHNNTRWPIKYGEWFEPTLPGDVAMIYSIELNDGSYIGRRHLDVITGDQLMPGKSVSFTIPREELPGNSKIYVRFVFTWELDDEQEFPGEAEHRAYFISGQLPHWPQ